MVGSSLPSVVCRRDHILLCFLCICLCIVICLTFCPLRCFYVLSSVMVSATISAYKLCSVRLYLQWFVGWLISWCPTYTDYASTMTGVLLVAGTVCPPLTHGFTPSFLVGSVLLMFLVFCVVFLFRLSSSILCCPFGFQPHRWCTGSVLSSSVVGRGFEPRSGQIKDYKIGMCCFSAQHVALRKKSRLIGSESG